MPSQYGSPIWAGHRPRADAAAVALARRAGAIAVGKTVTTEFATRHPGPTTNPRNPAHTPGGSSSGSAAGAAAGFFHAGFGTQTAGSIIRPAAFCGAVGFKPSFGTLHRGRHEGDERVARHDRRHRRQRRRLRAVHGGADRARLRRPGSAARRRAAPRPVPRPDRRSGRARNPGPARPRRRRGEQGGRDRDAAAAAVRDGRPRSTPIPP